MYVVDHEDVLDIAEFAAAFRMEPAVYLDHDVSNRLPLRVLRDHDSGALCVSVL